jgi:hypothetical protein
VTERNTKVEDNLAVFTRVDRSNPPSDAVNKQSSSRGARESTQTTGFPFVGPPAAKPEVGISMNRPCTFAQTKNTRAAHKKSLNNCRLEGDTEPLLMSTV